MISADPVVEPIRRYQPYGRRELKALPMILAGDYFYGPITAAIIEPFCAACEALTPDPFHPFHVALGAVPLKGPTSYRLHEMVDTGEGRNSECDFCHTKTRYECHLTDRFDWSFKVGRECIHRAEEPFSPLSQEAKELDRDRKRAARLGLQPDSLMYRILKLAGFPNPRSPQWLVKMVRKQAKKDGLL